MHFAEGSLYSEYSRYTGRKTGFYIPDHKGAQTMILDVNGIQTSWKSLS